MKTNPSPHEQINALANVHLGNCTVAVSGTTKDNRLFGGILFQIHPDYIIIHNDDVDGELRIPRNEIVEFQHHAPLASRHMATA
jgi:hypothetical protein